MFEIITEPNCVRINDTLIPKSKYNVTKLVKGVRVAGMDLDYTKTKIDGVQVTSATELFDFFKANGFSVGGGATGEGVASVTGSLVNNTDPLNPIVSLPSGGTATTFLRGDNTWVVPTNTTYTVMSDAEYTTGTSTTGRVVSAVGLKRDIQKEINNKMSFGVVTSDATGDFSVLFPAGKFTQPPHIQLTAVVVGEAMTRCVALVSGTLTKDGFSGEVFDGQGAFHSGEVYWLAIGQ